MEILWRRVCGADDNTRPRSHQHRQRGAVLVEMVVIVPILLVLVFGVMEAGWFFAQHVELANAAREGARLAAVDYGTAGEIVDETCTRTALSGPNATVTITLGTVLDPDLGEPPGTPDSVTVGMTKTYDSLTGFLDPIFDGLSMSSSVEMRTERPLEKLVADGSGVCP